MAASNHPERRDRLRWLLLKVGILGLTAGFVAMLALAALLLAIGLKVNGSHGGLWSLWRNQGMSLLSLPVDQPDANVGGGFSQVLAVVLGLLGLILPALYLGAVVFRLFLHPDVFVFRRKVALISSPKTFPQLPDDGYVLAFRVYNGSKLRALEVEFRVVHQHWFEPEEEEGSVVRNFEIEPINSKWPMADRHVPYALFVPLDSGDVCNDGGRRNLRRIHGLEVDNRDRLVVHVLGTMPELGDSFVERHAFELPRCVTDEKYGTIQIVYGGDSKSWKGWGAFDA